MPSSYVRGDRVMQQLYQYSKAIVCHFGKPSLFITFTANPKWVGIEKELLPNQSTAHSPDLVAREFNLKVCDLLYQIRHKEVCGPGLGWFSTIEYQKQGLPHLHLVVFLRPDNQFLTGDNIDGLISGELAAAANVVGQEHGGIIETTMVHTHCLARNGSALCIQEQDPFSVLTCRKGYPRPFQAESIINEDGSPRYRGRDRGQSYILSVKRCGEDIRAIIDNCRVVPYSLYLSLPYKAHINVEVCVSVKAVKYIHKYIYQGGARATVMLDSEQDEIKQYLHGR